MQMPFGKHKGTPIAELPDDYLAWLFEEATIKEGHLKRNIEREYKTRFEPKAGPEQEKKARPKSGPGCWRCSFFEGLNAQQKDVAMKVIDAGYKVLALKNHPDQGGDVRAMAHINVVAQVLRDMVTTKT